MKKDFITDINNTVKSSLAKSMKNKIVKMKLEDLHEDDILKNIFRRDPEVVEELTKSMREKGFEKAHPIYVFYYKGHWYIADGHTRGEAARRAGLKWVYVVIKDYTYEQAMEITYKEQLVRRNLTDSDKFVMYLDFTTKYNSDSKGDQIEKVSALLGISVRQANKMNKIQQFATPDEISKLKEGGISINALEQQVTARVNAEKNKAEAKKIHDNEIASFIKNVDINKITSPINKNTTTKSVSTKNPKPVSVIDNDLFIMGIRYGIIHFSQGKAVEDILSYLSINPMTIEEVQNELHNF